MNTKFEAITNYFTLLAHLVIIDNTFPNIRWNNNSRWKNGRLGIGKHNKIIVILNFILDKKYMMQAIIEINK